MRILYITTIGSTMSFFTSFIAELMASGHTIDIATNESDKEVPEFYRDNKCKIYHIDTSRNPLSLGNIKAIWQIKCLVDKGGYDIIHCHTPLAGMCTRLASIGARKHGSKLIYTAHGFHFYKGAPLKNWLIYFPIEWICSFLTDVLITINKEDYRLAKRDMHAKKTYYVPGVGVDTKKFLAHDVDNYIRKELGMSENDFLIVSVGEYNQNKNHAVIIKALAKLKRPDIHYAIAGKGELLEQLNALSVNLGLENRVHILGFRNDIPELYQAADLCALPSIREGLGLAGIEGMSAGLPLIVSDNRGAREYVNSENGVRCPWYDDAAFAKGIKYLLNNKNLRTKMGKSSIRKSAKFDVVKVNRIMMKIYLDLSKN